MFHDILSWLTSTLLVCIFPVVTGHTKDSSSSRYVTIWALSLTHTLTHIHTRSHSVSLSFSPALLPSLPLSLSFFLSFLSLPLSRSRFLSLPLSRSLSLPLALSLPMLVYAFFSLTLP